MKELGPGNVTYNHPRQVSLRSNRCYWKVKLFVPEQMSGAFWAILGFQSNLHACTHIQCEFQQLHSMKTIEAERMRLQNKRLHVSFHRWTCIDNASRPGVFLFLEKQNGLVSGGSFILTHRMILYNLQLTLAVKPPYLYQPNTSTQYNLCLVAVCWKAPSIH